MLLCCQESTSEGIEEELGLAGAVAEDAESEYNTQNLRNGGRSQVGHLTGAYFTLSLMIAFYGPCDDSQGAVYFAPVRLSV